MRFSTKLRCRQGFRPDPAGKAYIAPQTHGQIKGRTPKGRGSGTYF